MNITRSIVNIIIRTLFIDDKSQFKAGSLKRLRQSLENVVGLKAGGAYH